MPYIIHMAINICTHIITTRQAIATIHPNTSIIDHYEFTLLLKPEFMHDNIMVINTN